MKIALINTVVDRGGAGRIVADIHKTIQDAGHSSFIFYGRGEQADDNSIKKFGNGLSVLAHGVGSRIFDAHGLLSRRATLRLIDWLNEFDPDVVHLHNAHGYYLNYPVLFNYLERQSLPLVWTLHDCWAFTGHCAHFEYARCEKWRIGCGNCPQIGEYPSSLLDRSQANYVKKQKSFTSLTKCRIVAPSEWLKNHIDQSFLKKYQCQVINNGVDLGVFKPVQEAPFAGDLSRDGKKTILGVASIWNKKKGVEIFAELSHLLHDDERLVIVGKMPKQFRRMFSEGAVLIDRVDSVDTLVRLYSGASVFVNPTFEDTFPTTNLEALACGLPVVTFPAGGSPETVDFRYGAVCLPSARDALIAARYFCDLDADIVAEECRAHVVKNFDKWDRFHEYIQVYEELATEKDLTDD